MLSQCLHKRAGPIPRVGVLAAADAHDKKAPASITWRPLGSSSCSQRWRRAIPVEQVRPVGECPERYFARPAAAVARQSASDRLARELAVVMQLGLLADAGRVVLDGLLGDHQQIGDPLGGVVFGDQLDVLSFSAPMAPIAGNGGAPIRDRRCRPAFPAARDGWRD